MSSSGMSSMAMNRVKREIQELRGSGETRVSMLDEADICHLEGEIVGPADTPYAGGIYKLDIVIVPKYPFSPPQVKFITKIWHPNVSSQTGAICLDVLKSEWSASMTLRTILLSIQALLTAPNPSDPQDAVVANQCMNNTELFQRIAKYWAVSYAGASRTGDINLDELDAKVAQVVAMGFDETSARAALSCNAFAVDAAVEYLFR